MTAQTSIRASTLIILPTIALRQWQMEISRFTTEGALTVKVSSFTSLHFFAHLIFSVRIRIHFKPLNFYFLNSYLHLYVLKIYHGSNRSTSIKDLKSVDIVLTSYAVRA